MQVILLKVVEKVGLRGDVVSVADGFARNFLLPRKLAQKATAGAVENIRRHDELRARHEARSHEDAEKIAETLRKTVLRFEVKAGPTGHLFGSVTASDVADELWRTRKIRVDRRKVELGEPIKRVGRHQVPIDLFEGVRVDVMTHVVPEGGELPPEEELVAVAEAPAADAAAASAAVEPAEAEVDAPAAPESAESVTEQD